MSLIGILFGIAFVTLLIKAIVETIWGSILILQGLLCHALAAILNLIAMCIRLGKKPEKKPEPKAQPQTAPRQATVGECVILMYYPNSEEAQRIRASLRRPA